ncbi:MAG: hypothetical protein HY901_15855, partial [Deltaproteobacteria bacterium]|nr:hypothetical protein [Deltaproteobacteria bacterium]
MRSVGTATLVALFLCLPKAAWGQARPAPGDELKVDWGIDGAVIFTTGLGWIATELTKDSLAPATCRWCSRNSLDDAVSDGLGWSNTRLASRASDLTTFAILPVLTLAGGVLASGLDGRMRQAPADAALVIEAVTVSSFLNQMIKFSVGRERP